MSYRKPLRGLIHSLSDSVLSELNIAATIQLDDFAKFDTSAGIVIIRGTGLCQYFADGHALSNNIISDEITTNSIEDAYAFILINISDKFIEYL